MRQSTKRNKLITFFLLVLFPLLGLSQVNFQQGTPFIKNYTFKEINAGPQIWSWNQDKRGMVYVGDMSGVVEFNGREWRRIKTANNTIVREMAVDSLGRIYLGSSDDFGFLQPNNTGDMEFISLSKLVITKGIKFLDIWKVFATSDGIYFCSNKYLFRYFNKKITVIPVDFLVQDAYLINKKLYIPTNHGLCLIQGNKLVHLTTKVNFNLISLNYNEFLSLNADGKLYTFNLRTSKIKEFKTKAKGFIKENPLSVIERIDENKFVVASETNKILIISNNGDVLQYIDKESGLINGYIYKLYVDKDKNLWACTSKGISKIDINYQVYKFDEKYNINSNVLTSYLHNGIRYIGTIDGIYYLPKFDLNKPNATRKFIKIDTQTSECWKFMVVDEQLYAICSGGLMMINNKKAKLIYKIDSPQKAHCFSTNPLFPNVFFVGMRGKLLALKLKDTQDIKKVKVISEMHFPEITEKIRRITSDKEGNLWLNTQYNGIYFVRFIDGNMLNYCVTLLGKQNGLHNINNTKIYKVNNEITVSTAAGLFQPKFPIGKKRADSLIQFKYSKLFRDIIKDSYPIVEHLTDNKYLIAGNGMFYANIGGTKQAFDTCGFNRLNFVIESFSIDKDSMISLCSPEGLFYYDLRNQRNFDKPFNTIISKVKLGNDSVLFDGSFYKWIGSTKITSLTQNSDLVPKLNYGHNSMTFYYSGLFFEDPEATEFQHQLVGFDKNWSDWSTENKTNYTNLSENKYIFKVRAKNVYGIVSTVAEYKFVILPPWYRTWWSFTFYFLFFLAILYISMKLYGRVLQQQKISLETTVKERTSKIAEQAKKLEASNEKLVELNKFKQDISSMIVHDLKNPINIIINTTDSNPTDQLKRIKQTGKQMLNLVMNILDVHKYEETRITLKVEENHLISIAKMAVENIIFLSDNKNIAIETRIKNNLCVEADLEMIERVFINILTNAIKYTPNNGSILIDAELETNIKIKNSYVKVSISDTGIGIASDKINSVFDKFGQVAAKDSGSVRSSGIGLTYCKMVVEAHGGQINVESEAEKGSRFWFTLPGYIDDINNKIDAPVLDEFDHFESCQLSLTNQQLILESLIKLQNTDIYKISELYEIINCMDDSLNIDIKEWKKALIRSIDSGNEFLYNKLICSDRSTS
jgi:signal transduction histidine kinase/ligand-binding sensor domain-containing protein